jgi:hypothetical protein
MMEKMLNGTMLAAIVAGDKFTGFRCKRDGMSKRDDEMLVYQIGTRRHVAIYQHFTCFMSDGSEWEIWFAPIDEERLYFYKNAREIEGE